MATVAGWTPAPIFCTLCQMLQSWIPLILLAGAAPLWAEGQNALADFAPGLYAANPIGRSGVSHQECLARSADLMMGARSFRGCKSNSISADARQTVVTWRCEDGASGRTSIRRDSAGVYTVHLQGVDGKGLPFAEHAEWRRTGNC